jgi:hypothetical protein
VDQGVHNGQHARHPGAIVAGARRLQPVDTVLLGAIELEGGVRGKDGVEMG